VRNVGQTDRAKLIGAFILYVRENSQAYYGQSTPLNNTILAFKSRYIYNLFRSYWTEICRVAL
jgi:hypothetical protein